MVLILHTCKSNWYQLFIPPPPKKKNIYKKIQVTGDEYLPILYTSEIINIFEESIPILHTKEKVAPVHHSCDEYLPILYTSEIINMRNVSTKFRPKLLLKLSVLPGIQFRLPCTPQDNFSWVPNYSLGPPKYETKVSSKKFWSGLCEIAWFLWQPIANLRRRVCLQNYSYLSCYLS